MLKESALETEFSKLGLSASNAVLVHSSYKSLGAVEGGPKTVIEALTNTIGESGTLIMPVFNFGFTKGKHYNHSGMSQVLANAYSF